MRPHSNSNTFKGCHSIDIDVLWFLDVKKVREAKSIEKVAKEGAPQTKNIKTFILVVRCFVFVMFSDFLCLAFFYNFIKI